MESNPSAFALGAWVGRFLRDTRGVAILLASLIVAGGLYQVAESGRYMLGGASGTLRLDRLTGEVAVCQQARRDASDGLAVYYVECQPELKRR